MLNSLRNASKGPVAKVLLGLLVASFAVWGVSGAFSTAQSTTVVQAGETVVTPTEYSLAYRRALNELSRRFNTQLTAEQASQLGVDAIVLNELVSGAVLDEQARELGLGITEDELAETVRDDAAFQNFAGGFDRQLFRNTLRNIGMTEDEYFESQVDVARRRQLLSAVAADAVVPNAFADAIASFDAQSRDISYIRLTDANLPPTEPVDEAELGEWFATNSTRYAAPEYRAIRYALISPEALADASSVSDEEAREIYDSDPSRFSAPASRDVEQLLFPDRETAEVAAARLETGATFEELIAERGGEGGTITLRGVTQDTYPDPNVTGDVFALGLNETSGVLDGRFGPVIVRPTLILAESVRDFEDVRDEIKLDIAQRNASGELFDVSDAFEDARAGGATFEEAAAGQGLEVMTIDAIDQAGLDREGNPVDLPPGAALLDAAFAAEQGQDVPPIDAGSALLAFEVANIEPARDRTLDEVRDRVLADYEEERRSIALGQLANETRNAVETGSLEDAAAELDVPIERAFALRRNEAAEGLDLGTVRSAFSGPQGHVALSTNPDGGYFILHVDDIVTDAEVADAEPLSTEQDLLTQFVNDLQDSYRPTFNADLAAQVRTQ